MVRTDPPVVTVKPDNITVNETKDFLLFCEYEANPNSLDNVKWLRDGKPLNLTQSRYEGGNPEQTALLVKNASRDDIGMYRCELKNTYGADVSDNTVNVDVQCKFLIYEYAIQLADNHYHISLSHNL